MTFKIARRLTATIAIAAFVGGCATTNSTTGDNRQKDLIAERLDSYIFQEGAVRHDVTDSRVAKLWQEFNIFRRAGNVSGAKEKLEQAIALAPTDPGLWSGAAELELESNSHLRAENYAAKSNFLAAVENRPLRYRNWLIIQRAREGRGDLLGAREAQIESTKLSQ